MATYPRVGKISETFAEKTKMGWIKMLSGGERDIVNAHYVH